MSVWECVAGSAPAGPGFAVTAACIMDAWNTTSAVEKVSLHLDASFQLKFPAAGIHAELHNSGTMNAHSNIIIYIRIYYICMYISSAVCHLKQTAMF